MIGIKPALIAAIVLSAALGAAAGYRYAAAQGETRLARCEQAREAERRAAAEQTALLLSRAQDAESLALRRLAAARADYDRRLKETRRDLYTLTTGRDCLSGPLRLRLNAALAADDLPQGTGGAHPAAAAAAADPGEPAGGATDRDIAEWILEAASLYDDCRARIAALRQWDALTHGGRPAATNP